MVKTKTRQKLHSYSCTVIIQLNMQIYLLYVLTIFRLILIAEKDKVYEEFPTPLINRLEKHFVVTSTVLTDIQKELLKKLEAWATEYACIGLVTITSYIFVCINYILYLEILKLEMHLWGTKKILLLQ